jgi:eukaryotic-like serine/threonine-protein kinase
VSLSAGNRLGPYEIVAPLGAGGMGEVYRARDTRLERTVAIKILPAQLSSDPIRKQRFEREAKTISSLNHPHICVLHDVGHQDGIDYLVMECVEGETLAKRLEKGPLPLDQVVKFGGQIADALDKAHRSGVVHRDLKPGNIMLTPTGAKLLDFGLAKPVVSLATGATLTAAATPTTPVTQEGTILGTFQYMSPEQIEGKELDSRSDIFSLGAVLYEMWTGQRAFPGKSQLSVASAIFEKEPAPISTVKPLTPPSLDRAIRRCLAKDPEERWQTARDIAIELKWIADSGSSSGAAGPLANRASSRDRILAIALVLAAGAAIAFGILYVKRPATDTRVTRTYVKSEEGSGFIFSGDQKGFAISPDGLNLAYVASTPTPDSKSALWIRPMDSLHARLLPGTEAAGFPFWSPDGRYIGFFAGGKLKRIDAHGGPPAIICDAPDGRGGSWNQQDDIVFTPTVNSPIYRVSASGGPISQLTTQDPSKNETTHRWPSFLPDGRHFIFLAGSTFTPRESATNSILMGSLDSKEIKLLFHTHFQAAYASGHMLFLRQSSLMAQPFDAKRFELTGEATPVAEQVLEDSSIAHAWFSSSANGMLLYAEGAPKNRQLVWFDRDGKQVGAVPGDDAYAGIAASRDGKKLAYYLDGTGFDVWSFDITRGVKIPLTFGASSGQGNLYPVWSPDGKYVAYTSYRNGKYSLYQKPADGSGGETLLLAGIDHFRVPTSWSTDGKFLVYHEGVSGGTYANGVPGGWSIWVLPLFGDHKAYPFIQSTFSAREASFSPDGKWLAYCSNESGEYRVYVVPFPGPGGKWQVSLGDGRGPLWRRDGKEIFYLSADNKLMAVKVETSGGSLAAGGARMLFDSHSYGVFGRYGVSADGQRFVVVYEGNRPSSTLTSVVNWTADLKER